MNETKKDRLAQIAIAIAAAEEAGNYMAAQEAIDLYTATLSEK